MLKFTQVRTTQLAGLMAAALLFMAVPAAAQTYFAHFPRVVYSPHINGSGGFLVVWHQNDGAGGTNVVHARTISYGSTPVLGADNVAGAPASGTWWEAAPAAAYSATSQSFLVVWQTCCGGASVIQGVQLNLAGQPISGIITISGPGEGARDPNVVWNSSTNEFGVVYSGWDAHSAIVSVARVGASSGAVHGRNVVYRAGGTYITDITYNSHTGGYVVAYNDGGTTWTSATNSVGTELMRNPIGFGTYDGFSIAFNSTSATIAAVGHYTFEVGGALLNSNGTRLGAISQVTSSGNMGAFYPRVTTNAFTNTWNTSFSGNFSNVYNQALGSTGGGLAQLTNSFVAVPMSVRGTDVAFDPVRRLYLVVGAYGFGRAVYVNELGGPITAAATFAPGDAAVAPPPPPPPSGSTGGTTTGCSTPDPFAAMGGGACVNGGWLPPGSTGYVAPTTTNTGGCTTADPFAAMGGGACVNGGWLPPGSTGYVAPTSSNTGGCTTPDPFAAMGGGACVNGGWLPPGSTGYVAPSTNTGGCTTADPFAAMGGGTCVNGGWLPPSGSTGSAGGGGGCSTPDPFTAMGGGICVNGGWVPPTSLGGCTTADPFASMGGGTCVNGGWVPTSSTSGTTSTSSGLPVCSGVGPPPVSGWYYYNGGWVPSSHPDAYRATCVGY